MLCLYFIAIFVHRTHEFPFFSFSRLFRKVPARLGFSFVFSDLFHGNHELTLGFQTSLTGYLPVRPVWYQKGLFFLLFSPTLSMFITSLFWASQTSIYLSQFISALAFIHELHEFLLFRMKRTIFSLDGK